jgi:hypothetical protein
MYLAPSAFAKFGVKALHVGTKSGAVDYLYTAGNTVVEQGFVDRKRYYHFDVSDASGTVRWSSACRPATPSGTVSGSYTVQATDPLSTSNGWRFRLREFSNASSCASSSSAQHDASLYFDVASATSYNSAALTTPQSFFKAGATAYVQVAGVGKVNGSGSNSALGVGTWSTSWILPSGATACANTKSNASDLPGSTAGGQLPDRTSLSGSVMPNLQYRPSATAGVDAWNVESNYETQPCADFSSANQGQWSLLLSADSTHFVKLPAFSVDTAPPDTTLTSGPSNRTSSTSATFTFTSSTPGSTFQCSLDGAAASPCSSPETYTGLADGSHTFSVAAVDPAGNVDPTPASSSWTVDSTAPAVTLTSPAAGSYTNNTAPTFGGSAEVAAGDSSVTVSVYSGAGTAGSPIQTLTATVGAGGAWSVGAGSLAEGTYTVQAQQTDASSNTGYSPERVFTVDTTPPAVTVYTPANGTDTNDTMPQVSGTAGTAVGDIATVAVTVTGPSGPVNATTTVSSSGAWNVNLPVALADGHYTVQAAQQDLAGNTGYSYSHITIDTTPPQTFLDAAPVGTSSSSSATFSFHSTDALSQSGSSFQCQLDGGVWTTCTSPQTYYNLADGSHTFSVDAIDGAGNVDYTGQTTTWTINSTLPAVTLDAPAENSYTNDTTPVFSGTAGTVAGDSGVQVLIYSGTDLSGSPVQTLSAVVASNGTWSTTAAALADGTYVAYARQSNGAGTATSDAHTFTVNTQAPTTTITVGPPGDSGTGSASFSFTSSEAGSTFQCQLDGSGWTACVSPQDYSGLGDGSHTFQVRAIDQAGNVGAAASQTWTVNTSLPALSLSSPGDGSFSNNPMLSISGTGGIAAGDASTVTVKLYSGASIAGSPLESIVTSVSSSTGAWTIHPSPGLADGTYTVYAQQTGSAGTASTAAHTFTIETVPPTTSITSGPQGATSATSARFAFVSSAAGSTFQCQLDGGAWTTCSSPQSYSSLASGTHTFSVRATDPAGNTDPSPAQQAWTIDPTVPVTLTAPADGSTTNNNLLTFSGAANAANGQVTLEVDDSDGNPVEDLTASAGSSWSVAASPALPDGTYTAFASQLGSDGVTTDYSNVISFAVDTTPPAVTLTGAPSGTINDPTPSFAGAAGVATGDLGTVDVQLYSGSVASGTPLQTMSVTQTGGAWSATASTLADGTYTVRAKQSDAAGNTGFTSTRTFTVDATPPAVTLTTAPSGAITDTTPSFGGAAGVATGDLATVDVELYSGSVASGTPLQTMAVTPTGGAWSATASSLADGTYTVRAQQSDAAGNTGYTSSSTFTVDTTPPSTTITSGPPASTTATSASFAFISSESGSTFECQLDGGAWTACSSPQAYSSLAAGSHTFSVRATDPAGNVDPAPPSQSWTITAGGGGGGTGGGTGGSTGGTGSGSGGTGGTSGTTPTAGLLQFVLTGKARQHLRRKPSARLVARARCSTACTVVLSGKFVIASASRRGHQVKARAMKVSRLLVTSVTAGKVIKLQIKLSKRLRKRLLAALAQHRRITLTVTGVATVPGMRSATAVVKIRLVL